MADARVSLGDPRDIRDVKQLCVRCGCELDQPGQPNTRDNGHGECAGCQSEFRGLPTGMEPLSGFARKDSVERNVVCLIIKPVNVKRWFSRPAALPHIDLDSIDYTGLMKVVSELFDPQGPSNVWLPDDVIDQADLDAATEKGQVAASCCGTFAKLLLGIEPNSKGLLPVRKKWAGLHQVKDRHLVSAPAVLTFVVDGDDFKDWFAELRKQLQIEKIDFGETLRRARLGTLKYEGVLPTAFLASLRATFGVDYEPNCEMVYAASTPPKDDDEDD